MTGTSFGIDLYWLPLGAGGNFVRLNERVYGAIEAAPSQFGRRARVHAATVPHR